MLKPRKELINFQETWSFSWEILKKNFIFLLALTLLLAIITGPFELLDFFWNEYSFFTTLLEILFYLAFFLLYVVVSITLSYNATLLYIDISRGVEPELGKLFSFPSENTFRYFVGSLVYGFVVGVGLVLLILPGVYFALKFIFVPTLIADKEVSILKAFSMSGEMLEGEMWQMFAFQLVLLLLLLAICVVGLLFFLVGVIPAIFVVCYMYTFTHLHLYNKFLGK
jgi:hypothetical protein